MSRNNVALSFEDICRTSGLYTSQCKECGSYNNFDPNNRSDALELGRNALGQGFDIAVGITDVDSLEQAIDTLCLDAEEHGSCSLDCPGNREPQEH
jgi:hypothetical protein